MNLPNTISALRIAAAPFLLLLPFLPSPGMRLLAFVLFVLAALTDYWDGVIARKRSLVTDLGRMLDPLADKILLLATIIPVYLLMRPRAHGLARALNLEADTHSYPFVTPFGEIALPLWVVIVVLGREVAMTVFRFLAARRGVVIAAISTAKWKTAFQVIWIGAAYFWFFAGTFAAARGWVGGWWSVAAAVIGVVGVAAMTGAVALTLYSMGVYVRRFGAVFVRPAATR